MIALGSHALCLSRPEAKDASALIRALRKVPGVVDVVLTEEWVAVYGQPHRPLPDRAALQWALDAPDVLQPPRTHRFAAIYDGQDLSAFADAIGMSTGEVIRFHASAEYRVAMLGFLPGFAYLSGLDSRLELPRRNQPRARIEAGSLAIGGAYSAVYPCASPGGWHLIGRVPGAKFFGADGALLQPGDRVFFDPVT